MCSMLIKIEDQDLTKFYKEKIMTTSNLTVAGTATLPSATSATLGGVLVDSTASGLLVMTDGHIAVKASTGLLIDGTGHLKVDPSLNTLTNYLPLTGGDVQSHFSVFDPLDASSNIEFNTSGGNSYIGFNVPEPGGTSGIVFADNTTQSTAYDPFAVYSLNGVVHNIDTLVTTGLTTGNTCYLTAAANTQIVSIATGAYTGTMPIVFPTPNADGYFFEIVIINGSGSYSVSGLGQDGITPATIFFEFGSSSYEMGGFRYLESTNTWYQVS